MHTYLIEMLECPACHDRLNWNIIDQNANRIEAAEAHCNACSATYPIRDGIGLFLTPDLPRDDLWEHVDSKLTQYLRKHPELEQQLMDVPLATLAPADQFFRSLVLEERGNYIEAHLAEESANKGLYTEDHTRCQNSQLDYVVEWLSATDGPIVDLASGRCYLAEKLLRRLNRPIVITDFSPVVLRNNRRRLESFDLYDRASLLAFDARRTPFRDGVVENMTTNLGLSNIEDPGSLLKELRRIVAGAFLAICNFYPEEEETNAKVIREAGLETMLYRRRALRHYAEAGWDVEVSNVCKGAARPTPSGIVIEDARIDRLPVTDTHLEWCVLLGTHHVSS